MHAIEISGIQKGYFGKPVLNNISLQLETGKFYALVGQNGSGKSTLMRILARLESPDRGDGKVAGLTLSEDDPNFFRNVGYASESINYDSWLGIKDFFGTIGRLYPKWDLEFFKTIVVELGLDLNSKFANLSRGQRIQISMAFAFAIRPLVLLFDEVTAVLDPHARGYMLRLCQNFILNGGTVLMATNIVSEIHGIASTLIYLEGSQVRLVSDVESLSQSFVRLKKQPNTKDHPIFKNPECLDLRISDDDSILCLIPIAGIKADKLPDELIYPGKVTAEDIFIYYSLLASKALK